MVSRHQAINMKVLKGRGHDGGCGLTRMHMRITMCIPKEPPNTMKTERVTFLASPDFKRYLSTQASNDGISVGELIRGRCQAQRKNAHARSQERELSALTAELRRSMAEAHDSLKEGLQAAAKAMSSIRNARDGAARRRAA